MKRILWVTTLLLMAACKREITLGDDYGMSATDAGSGDDAAVSPGFVASSVQLPASVSELVGVENAWPTMALSGDGTTLAIGSPGDANSAVGINAMTSDEGAPSSGAVFVFRRHATECLSLMRGTHVTRTSDFSSVWRGHSECHSHCHCVRLRLDRSLCALTLAIETAS